MTVEMSANLFEENRQSHIVNHVTLSCRQNTLRINVSKIYQGRVIGMVQKFNSEMLLSILLRHFFYQYWFCLLYTSDAADE